MAGIYDTWKDPATGETSVTCSIVTTEANEFMKAIHHRMPVIVSPDKYALWLDPKGSDAAALDGIMRPCDPDLLASHDVSRSVNSPAHNHSDCIAPSV